MLCPRPLPPKETPALFVATAAKGAVFLKSNTQKLAVNAMLAALCAVLGYVSLDFGNIKITFESFPVTLGALLFGPMDGGLIAFVGTLIYQLLRYGLSVTTLLWVLPIVVCGLLVGGISAKAKYALTRTQMLLTVMIGELVITLLNTGVLYIDSKIFGYYSFSFIFGTLLLRLGICLVKGFVFGLVMSPLTQTIRKNRNMQNS